MNSSNNDKKNILEEIKKSPVKLLAWIYPYVLAVGIGIGLFYMAKINEVERRTVPPALPDSVTAAPEDLKLIMPSNTPKADVNELTHHSGALVEKGKALFTTTCVSCHGADGKGDGAAAASLNPKPRNFTSAQGWINGAKLSGIFKTLSEGITGSAMVAFDTFSPEDKFALAQYIRAAFVPNPPQDSHDDLANLEQTYKLSEGEKNPGQIPISDAMILVSSDASERHEKILSALNQILKDSQNNGAEIFKKVTDDKVKALTMLSSSGEWKSSEQVFVDLVVDELGQAGFNDNVHRLTSDEWDSFYNYMNKLF